MATLDNEKQITDSHWYSKDAQPAYKIKMKNGKERSTNLRDARKYNLIPSVTTIFNIMAKKGLDTWKLNKAIESAKANPQGEEESDAHYNSRIIELSKSEVKDAAELGTKIHDAIDQSFDGIPVPRELCSYVEPVLNYIKASGFTDIERETVLVSNQHGFAGRVDMIAKAFGKNVVIDFKTRKTKEDEKITPYEFQPMQISAYAHSRFGSFKNVYGINVYISTTEIGRMEIITYNAERLQKEFEAFLNMLALWRYLTNYDPRS
jgi:hypothetical protein